ncbi:anthranilate phosphoribosyltransferase [Candidatus Micrarchaeota archaeon]|nr:anthranilate phosphoribosyltransferase [Candidatus Micrarchaeota archaeon]
MQTPLTRLQNNADLDEKQAQELADGFFDGTLDEAQMKESLLALNAKGITVDELVGFAQSMRQHGVHIQTKTPCADTCGTGGDGLKTFNISTAAAFVVTACGVSVAKHGNRSVSSQTGSADVLEALGVRVNLPPEKTTQMIDTVGFGFLFAPTYHPAMKRVAPVRKALGVKTIFNMLGPLTNPASAAYQVIGTYNPECQDKMAHAVTRVGIRRALVVHGNGMDEAGFGISRILDVTGGKIEESNLDAASLGITGTITDLTVRNAAESATKIRKALSSADKMETQIVCLNAALALVAAGKAKDAHEGFHQARKAVSTGWAMKKLQESVEAGRE